MYIGTNILVYERWLMLKFRYTAGPMLSPFHSLALLMHVNQKGHPTDIVGFSCILPRPTDKSTTRDKVREINKRLIIWSSANGYILVLLAPS